MLQSKSVTETTISSDRVLPFQPEGPCAPLEAHEVQVDAYLPAVREIALGIARTLPPWVDRESLIQAGSVGLVDAARRYNARRDVAFRAYAGYRIRGEIMEYLRSLDVKTRAVRVWGRELAAARSRCLTRYGREASAEEVAAELGVPLERYYQLDQRVHDAAVLSLEEAQVAEAAEETLARESSIPGLLLDPATAVESKDLVEKLAAAIQRLPQRERLVVTLYYYEDMTLREIGKTLNLTEGRISQILSKTTIRLRQVLTDGESRQSARQPVACIPYAGERAREQAA